VDLARDRRKSRFSDYPHEGKEDLMPKILIEFEPEGMSDEERAESTQEIVTLLNLVLPYMVSNVVISDPEEVS
jgi:hypothetical protein